MFLVVDIFKLCNATTNDIAIGNLLYSVAKSLKLKIQGGIGHSY